MKRSRRTRKAAKTERSNEKRLYRLSLYITGQTPRSLASVRNLRQLCEGHLTGRFELKVIDIYQQPEMAQEAQIIAAPTLIKQLPLPLRRLVGDLSNEQRVLMALDLKVGPDSPASET